MDTNIVTEPMQVKPNSKVIKKLEQYEGECAIAAPVWHELLYGCHLMPSGARRERMNIWLQRIVRASFPILPYEEMAAAWHGRERARLDRLGKRRPYADGGIAAIAYVNELVVVTRNLGDFEGFHDLDVVDWSVSR